MKSKRSVIFTGDDFGFSRGVNRAIIEAHERGVLTRASLMVTGEAVEEAVVLAKTHPRLAVGLHLVLVCGKSAASPSEIPHLVDNAGRFPTQPIRAGLKYQFNRQARQELRFEIRAQLKRFLSTGLPLSHVDGHLHMHIHPVVLRALVEISTEFDIKAIRLPYEELSLALRFDRSGVAAKIIWAWLFKRLRCYGERSLRKAGIEFTDRVYGWLSSSRMTEEYLLRLIPQIRADRIEIYSHPAYETEGEPLNGSCGAEQAELAALISDKVREALVLNGFTWADARDAEEVAL